MIKQSNAIESKDHRIIKAINHALKIFLQIIHLKNFLETGKGY